MKVGTTEEIKQMFQDLQKEVENITMGVIELTYFMRGAITYDQMMNMTPGEKDLVRRFIDSRLESESEKMFPVY